MIQSVLPVTTKYNMFQEHTSHWQEIPDINQAIFNICQKENVKYIDLFTHFVDDNGQMKPEYTNDGLHHFRKRLHVMERNNYPLSKKIK